MRRWFQRLLTLALTGFLLPGVVWAQEAIIQGRVTDERGEPLPGANVSITELTIGSATDIDGNYSFTVPADLVRGQTVTLVARFVGYKPAEQQFELTPGRHTFDFTLEPDLLRLEEVVVTGVAAETPRKKLSFTVDRVDTEKLQQVIAPDPGTALQAKVAAAVVVRPTGEPGRDPSIRLRSATAIRGDQEPLIIVDGVIMEGSLADLNADDIESIEVIKDAAAASIWGSRAANGVIRIFTKRGTNVAAGRTQVTIRNDFGISSPYRFIDMAESHPYLVAEVNGKLRFVDQDGNPLSPGDNPVLDPDGIADNPWPCIEQPVKQPDGTITEELYCNISDPQRDFFTSNPTFNNYISVAQNTQKTNFMASFSNTREGGILREVTGYTRQNFRINLDHRVLNNLDFSASMMYGQSERDDVVEGPGSPFYGLLFMPPNVNLEAPNEEDGSKYNWDAAWVYGLSLELNPLYELANRDRKRRVVRQLASFKTNWRPFRWLMLEGLVGLDRQQTYWKDLFPRGYLSDNPADFKGRLYRFNQDNRAINTSLTALLSYSFGDLNTKLKLSYLYEDERTEQFSVTGREFAVSGVEDLGATVGDKTIDSYIADIRSENYFAILTFDFKDRYIGDVMIRRDGSSLFGPDARWATYYRASVAWRLGEEPFFNVPGINEFRLRASIGTAGLRPGFSAQYETFSIVSGNPVKNTLGNRLLRPAKSTAIEYGVNIDFLDRYSFQASYALNKTEDQILLVPLPAATGYRFQWRNAGTLEGNTFEMQLNTILAQRDDFSWTLDITFDRTRQKITELFVPPYRTGFYYIAPNETFGIIYGEYFARSLDDIAPMLDPGAATPYAGMSLDDFMVNEDGFVVLKSAYGTPDEKPIKVLDPASGNPVLRKIGDSNPDFNMGFATNLRYKNFNLYALVQWQKGGDVYNNTRQWVLRELRGGDVDQRGKKVKKPWGYYATLYNVNATNNYFVEDGGFVKLREVSLTYTLGRRALAAFMPSLQQLRVGVTGRNLLTFTGYKGYDPESARNVDVNGTADPTVFGGDSYGYPLFRSFTFTVQLVF
ncbi:SusC/RagA family TonB-linked outer membrane protein [Rhodothermus profundi]|uniref:TonB-linked outer membrane protein, SusC/RagA family n=1 Tax=Rhodothermus profundi TaxID=633813 RepID=A0A1M6W9B7_9BACT|nr:SusC/RagA family TonB-linked outer membrane protein [Rhodothermus profundi]SHK90321.1 TonB-linked outer membrane protein, SusC/RagA family [Rhodothermus profundi]